MITLLVRHLKYELFSKSVTIHILLLHKKSDHRFKICIEKNICEMIKLKDTRVVKFKLNVHVMYRFK